MNLLNLVPNPMVFELPSDLFTEWLEEGLTKHPGKTRLVAGFVAKKTMEWAANQQLIRVIDWLRVNGPYKGVRNKLSIVQLDSLATELWAAMRPKPPSLKEQAAKELLHLRMEMKRHGLDVPTTPALARVLESIPNTDS